MADQKIVSTDALSAIASDIKAAIGTKANASVVSAIGVNVEKLNDFSQRVELFNSIFNNELSTGLYYYGTVGAQLSTAENSNSKYSQVLDVSKYIGGVLKVELSNINASSSRKWGFCDENNIIKESHLESELFVYDEETEKYVVSVPIKYNKFFFSCLKSIEAKITYYFNNFIDNEQFERVLIWDNMKTATPKAVSPTLINSSTRAFSSEFEWNNQINMVVVSDVPVGYDYSIVRRVVSGSDGGGTETGWVSGDYTLKRMINEKYNFVLLKLKKTNGENFTSEDISTLNQSVVLTFGFNNAIENVEELQTCYVAPNGNDDNVGTYRNAPFATIQHAIDKGYKKIYVKAGEYADAVSLSNKKGVSIVLDRSFDSSSDTTPPKIVINGQTKSLSIGITISNCFDCFFSDIEIKNCSVNGFKIEKSEKLKFVSCLAHEIAIGQTAGGGFVMTYTDAEFYSCGVYNIGTNQASLSDTYHIDGFNIHGTGTTYFKDCFGYNCVDDGISHHDSCVGVIDGGEWYGCGKGGVASPTHGAIIDVKNIYSHDNGYGIYAFGETAVERTKPINFVNCACKNNRTIDIGIGSLYNANVWNCLYDTISTGENVNIIN